MTGGADEEKLLEALRSADGAVASTLDDQLREELAVELAFETHMFRARMDLLQARARGPEHLARLINRERIRGNLYEFLRDDLVDFLQKILCGQFAPPDFPDLTPVHRAIISRLRELGVYVFYPAGKDFSRPTILEKWYLRLNHTKQLTLHKIVHYFNIYSGRLYSLSDSEAPLEFQDRDALIGRMVDSEAYDISFQEIYEAEIALRDEILFSLLRNVSSARRIEYLVQKEIVNEISDDFVKGLHRQYSGRLEALVAEQDQARKQLQKEKDSMGVELSLATYAQSKEIQRNLPEGDERIDFALWYEPFMGVGGDYYRVVQFDKDEYAVLMADIAGHGIGAAMYINTLRLTFEDKISYLNRPARFIHKMNSELYGKMGDNFVTAIYVYINLKKGYLRYCNAGHPKGFLYGRGDARRRVRFLRPNSKVLGLFRKADFRELTLPIEPGQRLVVYTDGLSETFNTNMDMLGERGLMRLLDGSDNLTPDGTIEHLKRSLDEYRGEQKPEDDCSLLVTDFLS